MVKANSKEAILKEECNRIEAEVDTVEDQDMLGEVMKDSMEWDSILQCQWWVDLWVLLLKEWCLLMLNSFLLPKDSLPKWWFPRGLWFLFPSTILRNSKELKIIRVREETLLETLYTCRLNLLLRTMLPRSQVCCWMKTWWIWRSW